MSIEIRQAGIDEIDTLMEWRMRVLKEVFSLAPRQVAEDLARENRAYYLRAIPEGSHRACFAILDGQIVGCGGVCFYREMPSPDNASGKCAYLMNVYTRPEYQGRGVGTQVAEWLINEAHTWGAEKIYLETSEAGRRLYKRLGFDEMRDYMKLPRSAAE